VVASGQAERPVLIADDRDRGGPARLSSGASSVHGNLKSSRPADWLYLIGGLAVATVFAHRMMVFGLGPDIVQEDARQHLFWIARFRDPDLFRGDLVADYFQAVTPPGYALLFRGISLFGDPLPATKLIPYLLGLIVALFTYLSVRRLHDSPAVAFLATVLLSWYVWQEQDLASATPRAFSLPLLILLVWAVLRRKPLLVLTSVGLAALFYPVTGLLGLGLLGFGLIRVEHRRPALVRARSAWLTFLLACVLVGLALLPATLAAAPYGPLHSTAEAASMPEFGMNGRNAVFTRDLYWYWVRSSSTGLGLNNTDVLLGPSVPTLAEYAVLATPLLVLSLFWPGRVRTSVRGEALLLLQLLLVGLALFFLAHRLLFLLYYPNRYVHHTMPLVFSISAALGISVLVAIMADRLPSKLRRPVQHGVILLLALGLIFYPSRYDGYFQRDLHPLLTAYFRDQPPDILIAAVPSEADALATFTYRPVLASREHMIPLHKTYYEQVKVRMEDFITAYYSSHESEVLDFIQRYGVDYIVVNYDAYDSGDLDEVWGRRFQPFTRLARARLDRGKSYALEEASYRCPEVRDGKLVVVPATCFRAG
jgi:hypothetical protein